MRAPRPLTFAVAPAGDAVAGGLEWVHGASPGDIFEDRAFVRWLLGELAAAERWPEVLRVGRVVEGPMARGGRWGTWEEVLDLALLAARSMPASDEEAVAAEGWAQHQLGSRALLMDELGEARQRLHRALEKREANGDADGAALTRHNLGLLPLAVSGLLSVVTVLVGVVALAIPLADAEPWKVVETPVLDIEPEVLVVDENLPLRLTNRGTVALTGLEIGSGITGAVVDRVCDPLPVDDFCELRLDLTAVDEEQLPARITVGYEQSPAGDRRVVVVAAEE